MASIVKQIFTSNNVDIKDSQIEEMLTNLEFIRAFNAAKAEFYSPQKYAEANDEHEKKLLKVCLSVFLFDLVQGNT